MIGTARRAVALGLGMALAVTLSPPGASAAATKVKVKDNRFTPRKVTVEKGDRVKWVNRGDEMHTTTAKNGLWDATLSPGEKFKQRFRQRGTFRYVCTIHAGMRGRVVVV